MAIHLICLVVASAISMTAVFLPGTVTVFSLFVLLYFLVFNRLLPSIAIIILTTFLINITLSLNSPYRIFNETVAFGIIPIFLLYPILLPKIKCGIRNSLDDVHNRILVLMAFFLAWSAISLFWTDDVYHGVNVTVTLLACFLLLQIFIHTIDDEEALFKVLWMFPFIGIVLGILAVVSHWYSGSEGIDITDEIKFSVALIKDKKRAGGFAPPNMASAIMIVCFFINLSLFYGASLIKVIFLVISTAFILASVMLIMSKMGILTLFIGMVLFIIITPTFRNWRIKIFAAFTIIFSLVMAVGGSGVIHRFMLMMEKGVSGKNERLSWWALGFQKFADSFGLGLGAGGFLKYIDPVPGTHSFYFSILFDLGVIGALIFTFIVIFLIYSMITSLRRCKDERMQYVSYCFMINLFVLALQATAEDDVHTLHIWLMIALTLVVFKIAGRTATGATSVAPNGQEVQV